MRYVIFLMLLFPIRGFAQASEQPQVTIAAPSDPVVVGQPAIVRIKVLVPTFMPSPPVFPSLEKENLLVRLPEGASGPISESVEGETWSGVQRSYRLYPLQAGDIDLGALDVSVTFADPETNEPKQVSVPLPALTLTATVPEGARDLNPLILATDFGLNQQIEGETDMQNGGAITRRLTAKISGTTPFLIPTMIPEVQDPLLRAYPKEPRFAENEDRGVLSGQRVDEVVYLAQDGGETQLPAISVQWYNLETDNVETIDIQAVSLTLAPPKWEPPDADTIRTFVFWITLLALAIWAFMRFLRPRINSWRTKRRIAYEASPKIVQKKLKHALQEHDLSAAYSALDSLKALCDPPDVAGIENRLADIGARRYSGKAFPNAEEWSEAIAELKSLRLMSEKRPEKLPPLNP
ncbi:BatD family protein [Ruegeria arenilitoris]|uniref:BatD family protein n=1 Tax=Ruegeria arenilitoris TaxID=1173585 RepID=UPI00147ACEF4|nr:BatD family protein [Ruegeria arenilitoris]